MGELAAEIGATLPFALSSACRKAKTLANHAAYLQSWLSAMKADPAYIFKASTQASKAADYLLVVRAEAGSPAGTGDGGSSMTNIYTRRSTMFGRPVPKEIIEKRGEPVRYWGARAIFHPGTKHPIDLLPDRQGCKCADGLASKPLWIG